MLKYYLKMLRNSNWLFVISGIALLTLATLYFGSSDQLLAVYTQHRYFQTKPSAKGTKPQPHILFILADDLGFNDVGYHGSNIKTPNLDKLALSGVRLENYYVQPICSPTRGQLLTGRYQIHTGFQWLLWPSTPLGLSLDNPTIGDKLREAGYATHIVGKWHLGFMNKRYLPTNRGFDTFFGFLSGHSDYFTHETCDWKTCGYDLMENDVPANITNYKGVYSTFLFRDKVKEIIRNHHLNKPLFIYLPFQAVHEPNQVPERYLDLNTSTDAMAKKKIYTGMVTCMDEAIGDIVETMKAHGMWENTVLIFSTDNGGVHRIGSSNRPLRGHKGNLWEGGIRAVGFIHSMLLGEKISGSVSHALMHVTDWFPTLVKLAGGSLNGTKPLDGYDMWNTIKYRLESPRKEILHDINPRVTAPGKPLYNGTFNTTRRGALRIGDWKIITGYPGPRENLNITEDAANVWLFNIRQDPRENKDLSLKFPDKVESMLKRLEHYQNGMVPCPYPGKDPRANPVLHGGFWRPWVLENRHSFQQARLRVTNL